MMQEQRRLLVSQQPGETNLPPSGGKQVFTAHDEVNAMAEVVDNDGELVGPLLRAVAQQEITTLTAGLLALLAK